MKASAVKKKRADTSWSEADSSSEMTSFQKQTKTIVEEPVRFDPPSAANVESKEPPKIVQVI